MKNGWMIGSVLGIAVLALGAPEAHALRAYTQSTEACCDTHASCCAKSKSGKSALSGTATVGMFELDGVQADKDHGTCSAGKDCAHGRSVACKHVCPLSGILNPIVKPVEAVLTDAHMLITMPTRKAEPLN